MTTIQADRLSKAQNNPANINQDIMTFTAFFETEAELEKHIQYYEERAAQYVTPKKRKRAA